MAASTSCARNANHENQGAQQRERAHNSGKNIACRLCNRVFMNTQTLITHIESHIVEEEMMNLRRQNQQLQINQSNARRNLFVPVPFRPGGLPLLSRENLPQPVLPEYNFLGNNFSRQPNTVAQACSLLAKSGEKRQREEEIMEAKDFTRPFLSQLDSLFPKVVSDDQPVEKENGEEMDLTLRLGPIKQ